MKLIITDRIIAIIIKFRYPIALYLFIRYLSIEILIMVNPITKFDTIIFLPLAIRLFIRFIYKIDINISALKIALIIPKFSIPNILSYIIPINKFKYINEIIKYSSFSFPM